MLVATAGEAAGRIVGFLVAAWLIAGLVLWLFGGRRRPFGRVLLELPTIAFAVVLAVLVVIAQAANA